MDILETVVTIGCSLLASGGLWAFLDKVSARKSATTRLMLGLAHNEIIQQSLIYIARGWLTKDEYEDLMKYLWEPYSKFGGNGLAEKVINEVKGLPIRNPSIVPVEVTSTNK